jgi:hypothetical protein
LSLDDQPNIHTSNKLGGYYLASVLRLANELEIWDKNIDQWSQDTKERIWQCLADGIKELENTAQKGKAEEKSVFVKEHITTFIEPTLQAKFIFGEDVKESPWQWDIPSPAESEQTRSSHNQTVFPDQYLKLWKPIFYPTPCFGLSVILSDMP